MSNACFSPLFMLSMSPRNAVLLKCPWNRTLDAAWICACFAELSAEEMSSFTLKRCAACTLSNLWVLMFLSNSLYVLFSIVFKVWWRVPNCFSASSHDTTDVSEMWSCTLISSCLSQRRNDRLKFLSSKVMVSRDEFDLVIGVVGSAVLYPVFS